MQRLNPQLLVDIFGDDMPLEAIKFIASDSSDAFTFDGVIAELRKIREAHKNLTLTDRMFVTELVAFARRIRAQHSFDVPRGSPFSNSTEANLDAQLDEITSYVLQVGVGNDGYLVKLNDGTLLYCQDLLQVQTLKDSGHVPKKVLPIIVKGGVRDV